MNRCLGKLPAVHRPGALMLAAYLPERRMPIPEAVNNSSAVRDWGMMLNDQLGDCTCAAAGHMIQAWTARCGSEIILPDSDILKAYEAVGHYRPGHQSTDNGAIEADVLDHWTREGIGGHKLAAHAVIETSSEYQMKLAIWLFGAAYTGVALPISAQDQDLWAVVHGSSAEPGSWGGHAIPLLDYDAHSFDCITWGAVKKMTAAWRRKYMDEAYACLSEDWIDKASKMAPNHLDWDSLKSDLEKRFAR